MILDERVSVDTDSIAHLREFLGRHRRLFVLTGAGCSTESGIPDYRDESGAWKRRKPMTYQLFTGDDVARARYWARSMIGWRSFGGAEPNDAHRALAALEREGRVSLLVTQNVDRLHQAAGSHQVLDLHGRLDQVRCLDCQALFTRSDVQARLELQNPAWIRLAATAAPDGDADLDGHDFSEFQAPACLVCGGMLKPHVVFFGEDVPRERSERATAGVRSADAMLVVGSSMMVHSGFRYAQLASRLGIPIAAINLGVTRADPMLTLKVEMPCATALTQALNTPLNA